MSNPFFGYSNSLLRSSCSDR